MPPRLPLRPILGHSRSSGLPRPAACRLCTLPSLPARGLLGATRLNRTRPHPSRRLQSTISTISTPSPDPGTSRRFQNPRLELQSALNDLERHAPGLVSLPRLQLASRGLSQQPGHEAVRVAFLGASDGAGEPQAGRTAKEIVRLLLADPLHATPEAWEQKIDAHDAAQPLIIRVTGRQGRPTSHDNDAVTAEERVEFAYAQHGTIKEINVSSPSLSGDDGGMEILVMETASLPSFLGGNPSATDVSVEAFENATLSPTVEIPTSDDGRFTPLATPVHKTLLVGEGLRGAASIMAMPFVHDKDIIAATVNLSNYAPEDTADCPFINIDTKRAAAGLTLMRQGTGSPMEYQHLWYKSNLPSLLEWLKFEATSTDDGHTKPIVHKLLTSIVADFRSALEKEETKRQSPFSDGPGPDPQLVAALAPLATGLAEWGASAHTELQEQLDRAFTGIRWRKLGWWKLFWRVDDVGMLSSEMLSMRFLPDAERDIVYLAGRIQEATSRAVQQKQLVVYPDPNSEHHLYSTTLGHAGRSESSQTTSTRNHMPKVSARWPTHISFTRMYLQDQTIPALQALAQRLVVEAYGTAGLASALGGLMFLSDFGVSECGAVVALGLAWSARRLQKRWERAREFWEGEVREEGRKAVRGVEKSIGEVLSSGGGLGDNDPLGLERQRQEEQNAKELAKAREILERAEGALARLK